MALREPSPAEVSKLIEDGSILNEQGAGVLVRWLTKTFSANPQQAKEFLERQGFDVRPTDRKDKLQFAIRNRAVSELVGEEDNPWKVLDPDGFEWQDIADLVFDIFIAGPIIAANITGGTAAGAALGGSIGTAVEPGGGTAVGTATGAAVGAAAGGVISGGGVEAARQFIGGLVGVNTKPDLGRVMTAGVLGAVIPGLSQRLARFPQVLLRGAKFANRKLTNLGRNLASRVAGSSEEEITTAASNAQRTARILSESETPGITLLDRMRGKIQELKLPQNRFPESIEMDSLLEKARPVPIDGLLKILQQRRVRPVGGQVRSVTAGKRMAEQIAKRFGFDSAEAAEEQGARISAQQAQELKQLIQGQIDFSGRPGEKFLNSALKKAQGHLRQRIVLALPSSQVRARYQRLNGQASKLIPRSGRDPTFRFGKGVVGKMEAINRLDKLIGEHKKTGAAPERFFESVTKGSRTQERRLVEQFDKLFGTDFVEEGMVTRLATASFGRDAPKLTATGQFIGSGLGASIATLFFGPEVGIPVGGFAGFIAASPKSMLRTARGLTKLEGTIRAGVRKTGRGARRVEPLQDFIGRRGGTAATSAASRERSFQTPIQLEPASSLTPEQRQGALQLVDEINAMPNLTPAQKIEEFERRAQSLIEQGVVQPQKVAAQ